MPHAAGLRHDQKRHGAVFHGRETALSLISNVLWDLRTIKGVVERVSVGPYACCSEMCIHLLVLTMTSYSTGVRLPTNSPLSHQFKSLECMPCAAGLRHDRKRHRSIFHGCETTQTIHKQCAAGLMDDRAIGSEAKTTCCTSQHCPAVRLGYECPRAVH